MLHFEGDKEFPQSAEDLWAKLSDARFLVQCIPDVQSVSHSEAGMAKCVLRPGFAFVRGTLDLTLHVADSVKGNSIRLDLNTKGIGSTSAVEILLALTSADLGSRMHWSAHVKELGGLLKAIPQGLLKAAAQKVITDAWSAVETKLKT